MTFFSPEFCTSQIIINLFTIIEKVKPIVTKKSGDPLIGFLEYFFFSFLFLVLIIILLFLKNNN